MRAPANVISVSPKAIRHFAAITIIATLCLAVFAEGESREALEAQLAQQKSQAQLRKVEAEKAAKEKAAGNGMAFRDNRKTKGSWGSDGGAPPDMVVALPTGQRSAFAGDAPMPAPARIAEPVTDPERGTGPLPPGLREAELTKKKAAQGEETERKPTQDEIARMTEAARRRSGGGD